MAAHPKPQRGEKLPAHLAFIRRLPCVICGARPSEAAHIRMNDAESGKMQSLGQKPDDRWAVPLCTYCHTRGPQAQHRSGERVWWLGHGINPLMLARLLFAVSPDVERGEMIARQARRWAPWRTET